MAVGAVRRKLKRQAGPYHEGLPNTRNYPVSVNFLVSEFLGTLVLGNTGGQAVTNRVNMEE